MAIWRIALCSVKWIITIREIEVEVTWNWYIDLTDAVANKLLELKAYWWCTQASTPTPTTPVDIVCNNWTLKVKDKELPVWYVRLESIELDAWPYYITNEKLYWSDVVSMRISQSWSSWRNVFWAYTSNTSEKNFSFYAYPTATWQAYLRYWDSLYRPVVWTGTKNLTFWSGGTTWFATNVSIPEQTFETEDVAYIGHLPNSNSSRFDWTFYWNIEVSDSNWTRLKWIPCKRKSDWVIWYYEVVNGNFIEPSGSGTPVAWAEDYSNLEVYVDGTKEKVWIWNTTTYDTIDWYWTYVTPNSIQTTRVYKGFGQLPAWTYKVSVSWSYELIMQWKNVETWLPTQYGNIWTWTTEWEFTADWTNYYWIAIRIPPNWSSAITSFTWTISFTDYQNTATCEDLLWVWDYKDEQEILSGDVITNVGVIVLDGTEDRTTIDQYNRVSIVIDNIVPPTSPRVLPAICTHFENLHNSESIWNITAWQFYTASPKRVYFHISQSTTAAWKQWLSDQLAAWTPVIVVYPLATPTTLSVAWQSLSIPAWNSRIEIVEWSILDLPLYAKYKANE